MKAGASCKSAAAANDEGPELVVSFGFSPSGGGGPAARCRGISERSTLDVVSDTTQPSNGAVRAVKPARNGNPSTVAERQRRHRQRIANGRVILAVEVDEVNLAEKLVEAGYLSSQDDSRSALQAALERAISDFAVVTVAP
jgi:hypothetical protein